jgi:hypothetical protein
MKWNERMSEKEKRTESRRLIEHNQTGRTPFTLFPLLEKNVVILLQFEFNTLIRPEATHRVMMRPCLFAVARKKHFPKENHVMPKFRRNMNMTQNNNCFYSIIIPKKLKPKREDLFVFLKY